MATKWRKDPATPKQLEYLKRIGFVLDRFLTKGEASDIIESGELIESPSQWSEEARNAPATKKQLDYLRSCGHQVSDSMTRGEAGYLITGGRGIQWQAPPNEVAFTRRKLCDDARRGVSEAESDELSDAKFYLRDAIDRRLRFWRDSFRDPRSIEEFTDQNADFYTHYGHRFQLPSDVQIQAVLDALDEHSPTWDKDMPQYFFQTLEYNFPNLLKTL